MEYQNYEDYMRQVLGYLPKNANNYVAYDYSNNQAYDNTYYRNEYVASLSEEEAMELYPEIYRLINPMVCKVCEANSSPITRELVEAMTDEVYNAIGDNETVVNIRVQTPKESSTETRENNLKSEVRSEGINARKLEERTDRINKTDRTSRRAEETRDSKVTRISREENVLSRESKVVKEPPLKTMGAETTTENREVRQLRPQNTILRDLIKILILRQLIGGNRPPFRPPMRPPFPRGAEISNTSTPFHGTRQAMVGANTQPSMMSMDYGNYLKF